MLPQHRNNCFTAQPSASFGSPLLSIMFLHPSDQTIVPLFITRRWLRQRFLLGFGSVGVRNGRGALPYQIGPRRGLEEDKDTRS